MYIHPKTIIVSFLCVTSFNLAFSRNIHTENTGGNFKNTQRIENLKAENLHIADHTTSAYAYVKHPELKMKRVKDERYLDKSLLDLNYCKREAKCQVLNHTTCMGSKLPYLSSTLDLTDLKTQQEVKLRKN